MSGRTVLVRNDRRSSETSFDLGLAPVGQVIEIRTRNSTYRIMFRHDAVVTNNRIRGVVLISTNPGAPDRTNATIQRMVYQGQEFHFGQDLLSHTSEVLSVSVGGRTIFH